MEQDKNLDKKTGKRFLQRPLTRNDIASFTSAVAKEVKKNGRQQVTVGPDRAKYLNWWAQEDLGLTFLSPHGYHPEDEDLLLEALKPGSLSRPLPIIIGEAPGMNDHHVPPRRTIQWPEWALRRGFAGLLMWAVTPDRPESSVEEPRAPYDYGQMREFVRKHPEIANPAVALLDLQRLRLKLIFDEALKIGVFDAGAKSKPRADSNPRQHHRNRRPAATGKQSQPKRRKAAPRRRASRLGRMPDTRVATVNIATEDQPRPGIFRKFLNWRHERKVAQEEAEAARLRRVKASNAEWKAAWVAKHPEFALTYENLTRGSSGARNLPRGAITSKRLGTQLTQTRQYPLQHAGIPGIQIGQQATPRWRQASDDYTHNLASHYQHANASIDFMRYQDSLLDGARRDRARSPIASVFDVTKVRSATTNSSLMTSAALSHYQHSSGNGSGLGFEHFKNTVQAISRNETIKLFPISGDCRTSRGTPASCYGEGGPVIIRSGMRPYNP